MHFSLQKAFSLIMLASPGLLFSPLQQALLRFSCDSDVDSISDNGLIRDIEFGYEGPGVYHIIGGGDYYNLALDDVGSGDGATAVVWYVFPSLLYPCKQ